MGVANAQQRVLHQPAGALAVSTPEEQDRIVRAQIQTFSEVAKMIGLKPK